MNKLSKVVALVAVGFSLGVFAADILYPDRSFERMSFNNPGVGEIGVGYYATATPCDADGDGDWDLYVTGGGFGGGCVYYENIGKRGGMSFYGKGVRKLGPAGRHFTMMPSGRYMLTRPDEICISGDDHRPGPSHLLGVGTNNVHWTRVRGNAWSCRDYDGDGLDDLLVGIGDWREFGWDNQYDGVRQAWKNSRVRGIVYLLRNLGPGKDGKAKWSEPRLIRIENGEPMETMGEPSPMLEDYDGDGDLDFILGDFVGNFTYFENIGTRKKPVYTSGRLLHDSTGGMLASSECIPFPQPIDFDGDGKVDILAAQEDSRVCFYRNTGRLSRGMPVFDPPAVLKCERNELRFGALVSPYVCDYDGDGDQDIVVGDAAGYLAWLENVSGPGIADPKWTGPHYISCEKPDFSGGDVTLRPDTFQHSPFKHRAGHNGSIQGPVEAGFGYTCETVADWDGDGDLDIMYNTVWGKPMLLENVGSRKKPRYAAPCGIEVEWGEGGQPRIEWEWFTPERSGKPKELISQWRTTPVMFDMNGDGLLDLVMSDAGGHLAFFERYRDAGGKLRLKAPRRAFINDKTGKAMGITGWAEGNGLGGGGNSGRRKVCLADWDGDGKVDIIMNGGVNAVLWTQVSAANGEWRFVRRGEFNNQKIAGHSTCPTVADFDGDGKLELVLGCEDGFIYKFRNAPLPAVK